MGEGSGRDDGAAGPGGSPSQQQFRGGQERPGKLLGTEVPDVQPGGDPLQKPPLPDRGRIDPGAVGEQPAVPAGHGHRIPGQKLSAPIPQHYAEIAGGLGPETLRDDEHENAPRPPPPPPPPPPASRVGDAGDPQPPLRGRPRPTPPRP